MYDEIPTWGPYPGVTEALRRLAERYRLVIVTNTDDVHASRLVENLQAPFDVVITAEQMGVYKPRLRAFEYMLSTPEFGEQSRVADAASEFLVDFLGENGRHARTAIGVAGLPRNSPVEIRMVCTAV